jgi:uncharacterized protein (TIGR01777 family)
MNILIAGATGFIGQALVRTLRQHQHQLTLLGRDYKKLHHLFATVGSLITWEQLETFDANTFDVIINLCGHNIGAIRWNDAFKRKVIQSRVDSTKRLVQWLIDHQAAPRFYNASAIGIYGNKPLSQPFDEDSLIEDDPANFLNQVGIAWENALAPAIAANIPVTITRFGVVLQRRDGMLKKLLPAFYLGLGSIMGSGKQIISWVHLDDIVKSYLFLLDRPNITGPINISSPNPIPQADFAKTLAQRLHRPLLLKMPECIIKLLFGEMGKYLILDGQQVLPKRLTEAGYMFDYPTLQLALTHEF